ncbi:MAG TPA: TolC family protein [Polyangiaceae bacterium]|nr:TolC family protein [Polyangiaceae bacterium]
MRLQSSLGYALFALGCVAHDTASDRAAVRSLVREHSVPELAPAPSAPLTPGGTPAATPQAAPVAAGESDPQRELERLGTEPLTLDSAVRIALWNNRELRAQLLALGVARGQLVQASVLPNLDFEAELLLPTERSGNRKWSLGAGFSLSDLILRGGRKGVAEEELSSARIEAAGATLDLAYQVRLAYYDFQAASQELTLLRTAHDAYAASVEAAQALHDAGNVTDLDLSTQQSAEQGAQLQLEQAEADAVDLRERLNVLLGLFGRDTGWRIQGPLPEPTAAIGPLERLETRAIQASLELAAARSTLLAAQRRFGAVQAEGWLPRLHVEARAENDGEYWQVGPALSGSLPLFDRQQGSAVSIRAQRDQLSERLDGAAITIRAATRAARAKALSAEQRVRRYREQLLPLRERIVAQTLLEYNAMQVGVFQLLEARREQLDAQRAYVATLREYWRARATLEQLLAGRLAGTLVLAETAASRPPAAGARSREEH